MYKFFLITILFFSAIYNIKSQSVQLHTKLGVQYCYPQKTETPANEFIDTPAPQKPRVGYSISLEGSTPLQGAIRSLYAEGGYSLQGATDYFDEKEKNDFHYAFLEAGFISALPLDLQVAVGIRGAYLLSGRNNYAVINKFDGSISGELAYLNKRWKYFVKMNQGLTNFYELDVPGQNVGDYIHYSFRNRLVQMGAAYKL